MYVAAKLIRTSSCKFKQDTYDDAQNYLYQAEIMHRVQSKSDELYEETVITDAKLKSSMIGNKANFNGNNTQQEVSIGDFSEVK